MREHSPRLILDLSLKFQPCIPIPCLFLDIELWNQGSGVLSSSSAKIRYFYIYISKQLSLKVTMMTGETDKEGHNQSWALHFYLEFLLGIPLL